jgi:hypothetical protein
LNKSSISFVGKSSSFFDYLPRQVDSITSRHRETRERERSCELKHMSHVRPILGIVQYDTPPTWRRKKKPVICILCMLKYAPTIFLFFFLFV